MIAALLCGLLAWATVPWLGLDSNWLALGLALVGLWFLTPYPKRMLARRDQRRRRS